jgi:hypothetical protein
VFDSWYLRVIHPFSFNPSLTVSHKSISTPLAHQTQCNTSEPFRCVLERQSISVGIYASRVKKKPFPLSNIDKPPKPKSIKGAEILTTAIQASKNIQQQ